MESALHSSTGKEIRHYMEANPSDITPHLALADHLEENGMPAHAEIMRLADHFHNHKHAIGQIAGTFVKEHSGHAHKSYLFHGDYDPPGEASVRLRLPAVGRNGHFEYVVGGLPHETAKHLHQSLVDEGAQWAYNRNRPHYAWPGGYPLVYQTLSDSTLCSECANGMNGSESDTQDGRGDEQWDIRGHGAPYYEGPTIQCEHCGQDIESAYGDPEERERRNDPEP